MANGDTAEAARTRIEMTDAGNKLLKCLLFPRHARNCRNFFGVSTTVYVNSPHLPAVLSLIARTINSCTITWQLIELAEKLVSFDSMGSLHFQETRNLHVETAKKTLKSQKPNLNFADLEIRIYV